MKAAIVTGVILGLAMNPAQAKIKCSKPDKDGVKACGSIKNGTRFWTMKIFEKTYRFTEYPKAGSKPYLYRNKEVKK